MVRAAEREFGYGASIRRLDDSCSFGRDGGGNADRMQESRFDRQCFRKRRGNAEQRFVRVGDRPLGYCLDIAGETKAAEPCEKAGIIAVERSQELDLTGIE